MSPALLALAALDADTLASVEAVISAATTYDGVAPLNERATMHLRGDGQHMVVRENGDRLLAYAQVDTEDQTVQVVVHPDHRQHGLGRALVDRIAAGQPDVRFWAFGDLPAAQGLAAQAGYQVVRELLIMERSLAELPDPKPRAGITIRPYDPTDADAVVAVNAAAFAHHPEQGAMDLTDFHRRLVDPSDIVVAVDSDTGHVIGFHWTKQHEDSLGEVYVIGVSPAAAGQGLGSTLLWTGLGHLARNGSDRVILYVEGDNAPAVRLYEASGFRTIHRDVLYGRSAPSEGERT